MENTTEPIWKIDGKPLTPRHPQARKRPNQIKAIVVIAVVVLAVLIFVVVATRGSNNSPREFAPPEQVAKEALAALTAGNNKEFLSSVDVGAFMCQMDSTGLTRRDYKEADKARRAELEASHAEFLIEDLFTPNNISRNYEITKQNVKENSASITIKPWIYFGNKLYKRILLVKGTDGWKISGLASPDY